MCVRFPMRGAAMLMGYASRPALRKRIPQSIWELRLPLCTLRCLCCMVVHRSWPCVPAVDFLWRCKAFASPNKNVAFAPVRRRGVGGTVCIR